MTQDFASAGDAAPLRVWKVALAVKKIGQASPYPGAINTLFVTLAFNVDVYALTHFYSSWSLVISGLLGGPANSTDIPVRDFTGGNAATFFSAREDGLLGTGSYYGEADPFLSSLTWGPSAWSIILGGVYQKSFTLIGRKDIRAGQLLTLAFDLRNRVEAQSSPSVSVDAGALPLQRVEMDRDSTTVLENIKNAVAGYAMPMR